MKKHIFAICALLVAASCAENNIDSAPTSEGDGRLRLSSAIEQTRVVGNEWEAEDAISVTMYQSGTTTPVGTPATKYLATEAGAKVDFEPASEGEALYFPASGTADVVAYYPYQEGAGDVLELNLSTYDDEPTEDLLWAKTENVSKTDEALNLSFERVFSKIAVTLKAGDGLEEEDLWGSMIDVYRFKVKADFDTASGELTIDEDYRTQVVTLDDTIAEGNMSCEAFILPQTVHDPYFKIITPEGEEFAVQVIDLEHYTSGAKHSYTIEVSYANMEFKGTIVDWNVDSENDLVLDDLWYLNEIDTDNFPEGNVWTIHDETATSEDFEGLKEALKAASEIAKSDGKTCEIELIFPSLTEIPKGALDLKDYDINSSLTKITAPNVEKLRANAINSCDALTEVSLPAATMIGANAFNSCVNLEKLNVGYDDKGEEHATVTSIDPTWLDVIKDANLAEINLSLGYLADTNVAVDATAKTLTYYDDSGTPTVQTLGSITLPGISTTLDQFADDANINLLGSSNIWLITDFDATAISSAEFADLRAVLDDAYADDPARVISLVFPNLTKIPEEAFFDSDSKTGGKIQSISAPNVTEIGEAAFVSCTALTSVFLPVAETISDGAFASCEKLTSVNLPAATKIGKAAFADCTALTSVDFPAATTIGEDAFYSCTALTSVNLPAATEIRNRAFYNCAAFTSIDLPAATTIGKAAFVNCNDLTSVNLPAATEIGVAAFADCTALASVDFPAAKKIGEDAFYSCDALTSVYLPAATTIGEEAFHGCNALKALYIGYDDENGKHATLNSIDPTWFTNVDDLTKINLRLGYLADPNVAVDVDAKTLTFSDGGDGNPTTQTFGSIIFAGRSVITTLADINGNTSLNYADYWIITDEDATADSATDFADLRAALDEAYEDDSSRVISLVFPNLTKIPKNAFFDSVNIAGSKIQSISAPNVTEIGVDAFAYCTALETVDFPAATTISDFTFYSCIALTSVSFPAATKIGGRAFMYCTALASVNIPAATMIGIQTFSECDALKTLYIGYDDESGKHATVTSIDPNWLTYVKDLTKITLYIGLWNEDDSNFSVSGDILSFDNGAESQTFSQIIEAGKM